MARFAIVIAFVLALASTANCRPLLRVLLSYAGLDGDKPGMGPRTGTPFDPPPGSATKNIMGATVATIATNGPGICAKYCATVQAATYYNYCNLAAGCGSIQIGTCDCKNTQGAPQYYADSTGTAGDGWISGPVDGASAGAAAQPSGGSAAFTDPAPKNLQGSTITSYDFGAVGTVADCQGKCAQDSNCKGFNFCSAAQGCGSFTVGRCDTKTWDSGAASFYGDATNVAGDGWLSSYRTNLTS